MCGVPNGASRSGFTGCHYLSLYRVELILALHSLRTGRDTQAVAFLLAPCLHVRQTQQVSEFKDYS